MASASVVMRRQWEPRPIRSGYALLECQLPMQLGLRLPTRGRLPKEILYLTHFLPARFPRRDRRNSRLQKPKLIRAAAWKISPKLLTNAASPKRGYRECGPSSLSSNVQRPILQPDELRHQSSILIPEQ